MGRWLRESPSDELGATLMSMWEPFTERARHSITLAQEEAQRFGSNFIDTGHILLGIVSESESVAAKVLETLGINLARVRAEVEAIIDRGAQTVQQEMVFTPRAKRVFEAAFEEARQLNHNYIGTEHLLLGLICEGEGIAARVLTHLGVDPANVRAQSTALSSRSAEVPRASPQTEGSATQGSMWEPFKEDARQAVVLAHSAAFSRGDSFIDNHHLLLAMIENKTGIGFETLDAAGVTSQRLSAAIDRAVGKAGPKAAADLEMVFSPGAKRTFEQAFGAALKLHHTFMNSGHLLVGMLDDTDVVARVFDELNLNREKLRSDAVARLRSI